MVCTRCGKNTDGIHTCSPSVEYFTELLEQYKRSTTALGDEVLYLLLKNAELEGRLRVHLESAEPRVLTGVVGE